MCWPFWLPVVWSDDGPVPIDGELPDCLDQLKSSSLELFQLQKSCSNVQSHLVGGCVVGGAGVVGKGVGLVGPWKHQGTLATELSQQHPRDWHWTEEIPTKPQSCLKMKPWKHGNQYQIAKWKKLLLKVLVQQFNLSYDCPIYIVGMSLSWRSQRKTHL